jgi:amidohydrolase
MKMILPNIDPAELEHLVGIRRDLHAHPELAFQERRTSDVVATVLQASGIEVHRGFGETGVVGVLHGRSAGKSIGLRADLDALPLQEANRCSHRSLSAGCMHACGHDGHTAILLGAARHLAARRAFDGTVNFIFQPAEEGGHCGALAMMRDGLFDKHPCSAIFAMHNMPGIPAGHFAFRTGASLASSNEFDISITGRGAHAAMPQNGIDPIMVAVQTVQALQGLITRTKDPLEMAVLSVTQIHSGNAYNVIPHDAVIRGTVRTYNSDVTALMESGIRRIAGAVAAAFEATAEVKFVRSYPPLVNWDGPTRIATQAALDLVGDQNVIRDAKPLTASEDFAWMLQKVPGCYLLIGNGGGDHRGQDAGLGPCQLHNPNYDFNDALLPVGVRYWARLVENFLAVS